MDRPQASHLLLLALVAAAALAPGLATIPLVETTEGRYASIAATMAETGDWLVPRYNGTPHLEKPPLTYWLAAASIRLLGRSELAVRLPCLLAGVGLVLVTAWLGAALFGRRTGLVGAGLLVGCLHFAGIERILATDPFLALSAAVAVAAFWEGYVAERGSGRERHAFFVFQLALACGVLAKGPLGLLWPVAAVVTALAATRQLRLLARMRWGVGLALIVETLGVWIAFLDRALPGAARYLVLDRSTAAARSSDGFHPGPWWYYLAVLPLGFFPWVLLAPEAIARWRSAPAGDEVTRASRWLLLGWSAVPLVLFSISPSKLASYVFPMFPALALLAAWASGEEGRGARRTAFATAFVLGAIGVGICVARPEWLGKSVPPGTAERLLALGRGRLAAPALAAALIAIAAGLVARGRGALLGTAAAMAVFTASAAVVAAGGADDFFSSKALAMRLKQEAKPGDRIVFYKCIPSSVSFYTGLRAILIEYERLKVPGALVDEIHDASYWHRDDPDALRQLLAEPERVLAIAKVRDYDRAVRDWQGQPGKASLLVAGQVPVREIARTAYEVLFTARDGAAAGEGGRDAGWHRKR